MTQPYFSRRALCIGMAFVASFGSFTPCAMAQDAKAAVSQQTIAEFDKALLEAKTGSSEARIRLGMRRVIRDAEILMESHKGDSSRFLILEFLFRANQQLLAIDKDAKYRKALLEICNELVKAPDAYADLRLEADLLLSQTELAKNGATKEDRAKALRPFVQRYIDTPAGPKVLRVAMVMAIELGDVRLIADLREMIARRYAANHEMINFQRDKLGGQVLGVPMAGTFKRSDGKTVRMPMDLLGRVSIVVFWSKEGDGLNYINGLAAASKVADENNNGRIQFMSINLDGLPDAGESILRKAGVDWPALHLPGGREHSIYKAYARSDPKMMPVTPTGQTALIMSGVGRERLLPDGGPDFQRMFQSVLARGWSEEQYAMQLSALMTADFLVFDPQGSIDPTLPPELKAAATNGKPKPLSRESGSVSEETLRAIQDCFVAPPQRYHLSYEDAKSNYAKAAELCRQAIAKYPKAPDLWIVRNRLMIAHLGLWKTAGKLADFEAAVAEAQVALDAGYPKGCDLVAQFCLARAALRDAGEKSGVLIDQFVAERGGESASGPALAAAALLSLDVADRMRYEKFRAAILKDHTESPMMWVFTSFLLDRHHRYWMFQVPFTAGWSYGRREGYFQTKGDVDEGLRMLKMELRTAEGKAMRIPEDLDADVTAIFFSVPPPWSSKRDDGLPPSPSRDVAAFASFAAGRPNGDVKTALAVFGDKPATATFTDRGRKEVPCKMLALPSGVDNPMVHRLGMLSVGNNVNSVLVDKSGRILSTISGLASHSSRSGNTLINVVTRQDELKVASLLEKGEVETANKFILTLAPPFDPEAVDERGRKLKAPKYHTSHLRARARVYWALGEMEKALADAEEVYSRTFGESGGMSMRTDELEESEALRDAIQEAMK